MASLIVRKLNASVITLDDIGITLIGTAGTERDLLSEQANDISLSADLAAAITNGDVIILDPRDGTTALSIANSILVVQNHNLSHYGISGGRFDGLDAPGSAPLDKFIVEYDTGSGQYIQVDPATVIEENSDAVSTVIGGMGTDGTDTTFDYSTDTIIIVGQDETNYDNVAPNGTFTGGDGVGGTAYAPGDTITLSDGTIITVGTVDVNGDVTDFTVTTSGSTNVVAGVALTQTATSGSGAGFTLTPEDANISAGTMSWSVDDVFLRNTGDTLDSGTLTIASGASIAIGPGADLTIVDAPTNPTDAANKEYVDSVASGLDPKESVRVATIAALTMGAAAGEWVYANPGGTGQGVGDNLTNNTASTTTIDGVLLADGDRILIKDQADAKQNGIYVVSGAAVGSATVLTRAEDQDGSPANEVSAGNYTFIEQGTQSDQGWVVQGDGLLSLNVDDIDWVQFSASASITPGIALSENAGTIDVDVDGATTATPVGVDTILFHDASGTPSASGSITRKVSLDNLLTDLDVVNGVVGTGIIVQTAANTYAARSINVSGAGALDGLAISNADGVSGNPVVGLDIQNLPARPAIDSADLVAVYDQAGNNVAYTVADIAGALAAVDSFKTWLGAGNTTGDASIIAASATDTATLTGGIGISIDFNDAASAGIVTYSFTNDGMADTAVAAADTIPFFDASNSGEAEYRAFSDVITDLGITTNLSASTDEDLLGIDVTGSVVGLDILGLTDGAGELAATDEIAVHDKSEGTAGANRKMTGQNIADGVETILGISGITISTINGQQILTITDTTRTGDPQLSSDSNEFSFGENRLTHLDWINSAGSAVDADAGYIMPLDGMVVFATGYCENTNANAKDIHLYIDGVDQGSVGSLAGGANANFRDTALEYTFTAGQKLRLQAVGSGTGRIEDTVVSVHVRWMA